MKATLPWFAALLLAGAATGTAEANPWLPYCPPRVAPDACGPGFYCAHPCGMIYGPGHCVYPPFPPFNGILPCIQPCPSMSAYPTHPYARSPRDFFMLMD